MATNYPGPYELRLNYITTPASLPSLTHQQRLSLNLESAPTPGDEFFQMNVLVHNNSATPTLDSVVDEYVALLKPLHYTGSSIVNAELWAYEEGSFNADFVSAYEINEAGTSVTNASFARQDTLTFRSSLGGSMRWTMLELGISGSSGTFPPLGGSADMDAIVAYITAADGWIIARDNGRPFAGVKYLTGQNEAVFRKRAR